jgi:hypothetical protein
MSFTSSPEHLNPNDPLYYAPPRLRRGANFPSAPAQETRPDRLRPIPPASGFDALLEQAVANSLRLTPDTESVSEPPASAFEDDHRRGLFSVAARFAAAVAASAVVAFVVVVMVPMSPKSDPSKLAGSEHRANVASATTAPSNLTPEESQALLQKFLQWQQRDSAEQQGAR